jgi:pimeloyl-ACP methyl ester carboxylesterase
MIRRLVLLPGMDGTGELFADFVEALPDAFDGRVVRYPCGEILSYNELRTLVQSAAPAAEPFVLVAESFSSPLAVQFAALNPPNLKALIICAGFVTSPAEGWRRLAASLLAPVLFRLPLPRICAKYFLLGTNPPEALLTAVRSALSAVRPTVLSARLRAILACDARAALARINVPILYLQAAHDRLVPASALEEIQRINPRTAVVKIPGPHLLLQCEPEKATASIAVFIETLG